MDWYFISQTSPGSLDWDLGVAVAHKLQEQGGGVFAKGLGQGFKRAPRFRAGSALTVGCGWGQRGQILLTTHVIEGQAPIARFRLVLTTNPGLSSGDWPDSVQYLPYPIDPVFYETEDSGSVFEVTAQLRLEHRPRLVFGGNYHDGAGLTTLLTTAKQVLKQQGELVLLNGLKFRDQLAPVVQRLNLAGVAIFAPPLAPDLESAIMHSADLYIDPTRGGELPANTLKSLAARLPVVMWRDSLGAQMSQGAVLMVEPDRPEVWPDAISEGLDNGRLRERMMERGWEALKAHHSERVAEQFMLSARKRGLTRE
ncbi:MAG: glycosyltransferase [Sulfobacillus sp.]